MSGKAHIGVLALQGDVREHMQAFLRACDARGYESELIPVRRPGDLEGLDVLALPGGESTTIMRLIDQYGLREPLTDFSGGYFATCAGMVALSSEVIEETRFTPLCIFPYAVSRNAFGRQRESFQGAISISGLTSPFCGVFIRAPVVVDPRGAEVLSSLDAGAIALSYGIHMSFSFHPELVSDTRLHELFLENIL
ncbi:MAG: pyridoxal 5'-phosphate synthase glutaminase subunit PdxT [Euryarchaeota archaeon]|nr:pyridoxal 5'-phosphate synthase glutaminase subunit PdxT [Euryarchaeota archaeon]